MSRNIVFEGWLTKSPPTKRIWRTKWRRRWFTLRQSCELPGQYFLDYYADRNCRRLKGTINLDLCEQVDAGLHMERSGTGSLDPKLRGSVFTIQTQLKTYHLEADCEVEMEKWVDAICKVCGLRSTDESSDVLATYESAMGTRYQNSLSMMSAMGDAHYECAEGTGPYIPISECITGVRAQDEQRAFTFDTKNIVRSTRMPFDRVTNNKAHQMYMSHPHIRLNNTEFSENESNLSDEECKSLNASQSNIRDWPVGKSFTKLSISPNRNGVSEDGPPVPPRPPKTFAMSKEAVQKETYYQGPKVQEPIEIQENVSLQCRAGESAPRRLSQGARTHLAPPSAGASRYTDDEDDYTPGQLSMQYSNLPSLPPAVDRALKPRRSSHSIGHINHLIGLSGLHIRNEIKADTLQYLDLDLQPSKPVPAKVPQSPRKKIDIGHGRSLSAAEDDADSAYKTVDFLKTEAFNITRQDAEASRSSHN